MTGRSTSGTHRRRRLAHLAVLATTLAGLTALSPLSTGASAQTAPPAPAAIIDNGTVQLGVNQHGQLNVDGGTPSAETGTTTVGLRYMPTNFESTAPGCACEGWGVGDELSRVSGHANQSWGSPQNLALIDFRATASTAVSTVEVNDGSGVGLMRVTHDYHPSTSSNLYEVTVTIENIGTTDVQPRYRRVMDWDTEPTAFAEMVTLDGAVSPNLRYSSNDGFASADPLSGPSDLGRVGPGSESPSGAFFVDAGPDDHGALFDFGFDPLPPAGEVRFNIYYGAAGNENDALLSLDFVGATVYSLGQPSSADGPTLGTPNTFMFGFGAVGGEAVPRLGLRKRADAPETAAGGTNGYTISLANPTGSTAAVTALTDVLPTGFAYVPGSSTLAGAPIADPGISSAGGQQTLVWPGPLSVPAMSTSTVHFAVTVPADMAVGEYFNVASATATNADGPLLVRSTGPVAPVSVPPPTVATDVTSTTGGGSITTDPATGDFTLTVPIGARSDLTVSALLTCADGAAPTGGVLQHNGIDYPMTPTASGTHTATIPGSALTSGPVTIAVTCPAGTVINTVGRIMLYDPSGVITDASTGLPISGATVTLHKKPFAMPDAGGETKDCRTVDTRPGPGWAGVPAGDPTTSELADPALAPAEISPLINPQVTGSDGRYGWDVAIGCWFVVVEADGYEDKVSALVGVPPEVLDLDLALTPVASDSTPPTMSCAATPSVIWPPDGKMIPVSTSVSVTDPTAPTSFVLSSVTMSDGALGVNAAGWTLGTADTAGSFKAARHAKDKAGRTFTLAYTGSDGAGNTSTCAVTVTVPHSMRK